jgi:amino acid transporter
MSRRADFPVPKLERSMKLLGALLITLSAITPASAVFIVAPGVLEQAGTGAFLAFLAGAVVSLFVAFVYAELASAYPLTGGEYAMIGHILGPLPGFIVLGLNQVTLVLITAVIALGLGTYAGFLFPGASPVTIAIVGTLVTTFLAILNIRTNAIITGAFLGVEILALVVLSVLGFLHVERPFTELLSNPVALTDGTLDPVTASAFGLAVVVAIFAYNGYGQAVYLGEEIEEAPKRIGSTIIWALILTVIAEIIPVTAILMGAPDLEALFGTENMVSGFITTVGGPRMNTFMSLGIALAILNALIAFIVMGARQLFSTGRDEVWTPGLNTALTRLHKKFHSPWVATLAVGFLSAAACLIDLDVLLIITGTSIVVIYIALCIAVMEGRRNGKTRHSAFRMKLFPAVPVLALLMMGYVLYANYQDVEIGRPSLWTTLALMAVSAAYYLVVLKPRGTWRLQGPEA